MNLGERYSQLRKKEKDENGKPIGVNRFADKIKLAPPRISELENNKREMSLTELKAYHSYFGVSFEYLLGETDDDTTNIELHNVCDYMGLCRTAVENIKLNSEIINILMQLDIFNEFISKLREILLLSQEQRYVNDWYEKYYIDNTMKKYEYIHSDVNKALADKLYYRDPTGPEGYICVLQDDCNLTEYSAQKAFFTLIEKISTYDKNDKMEFQNRYELVYKRIYSELKRCEKILMENPQKDYRGVFKEKISQLEEWLNSLNKEVFKDGKHNPKNE